ncbi:hypothetical protein A8H39_20595 [Paraburkholderia fungorum]|jgi:hypothetical protein|uniref:hypothetical protein n=1 Tax=Paraburkholderia fungorum TaxID=134537 RepID=UPI000489FE84|nr:hypothetical protein [Paraburkholderia fungorum]MBB5546345.1 hypothetical protein [Paraburkholderia fungorum]PNE58000.1 hypothetical protein A8H39_20595 [Paraburkholderia fungorum]
MTRETKHAERAAKHPLERNNEARAYFEALQARASRGPVAVWREVVETLTGSLPSWAARERRAQTKKVAA